jgi:hypothetical protein
MEEARMEETLDGSKPGRGLGVAMLLVLLIFIGLTVFASPMFQVLGFEYSAISSLVLSIVVGFYAAVSTRPAPVTDGIWNRVLHLAQPTFLLTAVPFAVGMVSAILIPNCALFDGVVSYFTVAVPGAAIAMLLGAVVGILGRSTKSRVLIFGAIWLATFALSLLPGYFEPQIFIYGWQFGFFPGFVWDPALELDAGYYLSRLEELTFALLVLEYFHLRIQRERQSWAIVGTLIAMVLGIPLAFFVNPIARIWSTHSSVAKYLDAAERVSSHPPRFSLKFREGALSTEQIKYLTDEIKWYLHSIDRTLGLIDTNSIASIYLYSNAEEMYQFVGTRSASISKPWLGEVHLTLNNVGSLKHELTHVLMREVGSRPFDISWSTGITEGIAMAMESTYDGLHTLDEQAARILQMHLATGVRDVMSFSGFASNASQKSYVLAGSFAAYLLHTYGAPTYVRLYTSLDFVQEYHRPIEQLEKDWIASLSVYQTPMSHEDSLRTRYYFGGNSILFRPCLRKLGKMEREAAIAYARKDYPAAGDLYAQIAQESGSISAIAGRARVLVAQGKFEQAKATLDTSRSSDSLQASVSLSYLKGHVAFLAGDTLHAIRYFEETAGYALSSSLSVSAYAEQRLCTIHMNNATRSDWKAYIYRQFTSAKAAESQKLLDSLESNAGSDSLKPFIAYLHSENALEKGQNSLAVGYLRRAMLLIPHNFEDSLFVFEAGLQLMKITKVMFSIQPPSEIRNAAKQELEELRDEIAFLNAQKKQ